MSPTSPSTSSTTTRPPERPEEGGAEVVGESLQENVEPQEQGVEPDVEMTDVSAFDEEGARQLELLTAQLRQVVEQGSGSGQDDDHDHAHEIAAGLFGGSIPDDFLAAIQEAEREGVAGPEGIAPDATESMINSFFSSDFLDQLNESSEMDLGILGDGHLDESMHMTFEDEHALLQDLPLSMNPSRQPSPSPLPNINGSLRFQFQGDSPTIDIPDYTALISLDLARPLADASALIPEKALPRPLIEPSPRTRTGSLPILGEDTGSINIDFLKPIVRAQEVQVSTPLKDRVEEETTPIPSEPILAPATPLAASSTLQARTPEEIEVEPVPAPVAREEEQVVAPPTELPGPAVKPPAAEPPVTTTTDPVKAPQQPVSTPGAEKSVEKVTITKSPLSSAPIKPTTAPITSPVSLPSAKPVPAGPPSSLNVRPAMVQRPPSTSTPTTAVKRPLPVDSPVKKPVGAPIPGARPPIARPLSMPTPRPAPTNAPAGPSTTIRPPMKKVPSMSAMQNSSSSSSTPPVRPPPPIPRIPSSTSTLLVRPPPPLPTAPTQPATNISEDPAHKNKRRRIEAGTEEDVEMVAMPDFSDILSISIPGISQINGDLLGGSEGDNPLSQAQIDEIVGKSARSPIAWRYQADQNVHFTASLGRPAQMNDTTNNVAGSSSGSKQAMPGPSSPARQEKDDLTTRSIANEEIDELEDPDDDDPAAQAQELLSMISALLPPGEMDNKDDGMNSEDELDGDNFKMEDSPAPSASGTNDDKGGKDKETPAEKKEKKRRNRLVLSCTECHRRKQQCDRNIPCARCVKRGVPELCHMDAPFMPNRKNKRKRDDGAFLQAMSAPGFDWNARVRALEELLRTNPAAFADLDLNGSLVDGVSSLQLPLSEMPTADEQEMQNQVQAVISLISQAQAAQHQLELDAQAPAVSMPRLQPTGQVLPSASSIEATVPIKTVVPPTKASASKPAPLHLSVKQEPSSAPDSPARPDLNVAQVKKPTPSGVEAPSTAKGIIPSAIPAVNTTTPSVPGSAPKTSVPIAAALGSADKTDLPAPIPSTGPSVSTVAPIPRAIPPVIPPSTSLPSTATTETFSNNLDDSPENSALRVTNAAPSVPGEVTDVAMTDGQPFRDPKPSTTISEETSHQTPSAVAADPTLDASPFVTVRQEGSVAVRPGADQSTGSSLVDQSANVADAGDVIMEDGSGPVPSHEAVQVTAAMTSSALDQADQAPFRPPPPVKVEAPRDTGTLNIPANLQAELAKLAKGVQDSAFAEEMHNAGADIDMNSILGDPAALLSQLASSMVPSPAAAPELPVPGEDDQNAILMDMIAQLTNGNNLAQNTSLLSNMLTPSHVAPPPTDLWSEVPQAEPETAQQVVGSFMSDLGHNKLNLGLAGFRQDDGSIFVPPTSRSVERSIHLRSGHIHDALPTEGYAPFLDLGPKLAFGAESNPYKEGRIASVQTTSLTGALRLGATFLSRFPASATMKRIYIPNPTIEEEACTIRDAGLEIRLYRFFDPRTGVVDWEGMREDLQNAPAQSIVLMYVGGSTPTGAELTVGQWRLATEVLKSKRHIALIAMEYQGLSSGNVDRDAQPLRTMVQNRIPLVVAQNFDAAMGLYADSPSILSVVTSSPTDKSRIESQLKSISRSMQTHPPPWGANIAATILGTQVAYDNWLVEVKAMADRLKSIRDKLYDQLTNRLKTPGNWSHIRKTHGMYCTTLLNAEQLQILAHREHIHLLPDGCFSLGCLNAAKIEQLARAIDNVIRHPVIEDDDLTAQAALQIEMALRQGFGEDVTF